MPLPPTTIGPAPPTPLSRLGRVDLACDAFEAAWAEGRLPRIEDYLADSPVGDRDELFSRLLRLELELRRAAGETPTAGLWVRRFPSEADRIARALANEASEADFSVDGLPTSLDGGEPSQGASPPPTLGPVSDGPGLVRVPALPVGTLVADYELLEPIGKGGMGVVYKAWQRGASRVVALKLIRPSWLAELGREHSQTAITLFLTEARTAANLHHQNIVTVHGVGEFDGRHYYSMRYIEGQSLAKILANGPLADDRAVALLEPVARGVHHAHGKGVLHRDLKPANILVDHGGTPFVADFGLAKLMAGPDGPGTGRERLGTPSYMSPEQARGSRELGPASDVYGLGATLYEVLTGRPPFQAATPSETLRQVRHVKPVSPRRLNPAIGKDLEAICLKCLDKDPGRRYLHAKALADDLRRYAEQKPTLARPVGMPAQAARKVRRNPVWSATLAAVLSLVVVLAVKVVNQANALSRLAQLARPIPSGTSPKVRETLVAEKVEAAVELARDGHGDLVRDLLSRRSFRPLIPPIRQRLEGEPRTVARSILADLNIPINPPVAQLTPCPK